MLTEQVMERWYAGDLDFIYPYLDERISWIGAAADQFFVGREKVESALKQASESMTPCRITKQNYILVDHGADFCIVSGMICVEVLQKESLLQERQRMSFVWRQIKDTLKISHIHVSNNASLVAPDEDFPVKASRELYRYIKHKLAEEKDIITVHGTDAMHYRLNRALVIYIEAIREYVVIHYENQTIRVHERLKDVHSRLFPEFISIHRSYFVNPIYIYKFKPYELILQDGQCLPISRHRYSAVVESLYQNTSSGS